MLRRVPIGHTVSAWPERQEPALLLGPGQVKFRAHVAVGEDADLGHRRNYVRHQRYETVERDLVAAGRFTLDQQSD
jgi:hypothetical protein